MVSRYGLNDLPTVTVLDGIRNYLGDAAEVRYAKGRDVVDAGFPDSELVGAPHGRRTGRHRQAVKQAAGCDVIVAVLGEDDKRVGESHSRTSLELPGRQQQLLEALHATGVPVVLVLVNGRAADRQLGGAKRPGHPRKLVPGRAGRHGHRRNPLRRLQPGRQTHDHLPAEHRTDRTELPYKKGSHGAQPRKGPNGGGVTRVLGSIYPSATG